MRFVQTRCLQKITVDLKMDELDMTAAENKATYEEIREYSRSTPV